MIRLDSNAKSGRWGTGKINRRGKELEEAIMRGNWRIANIVNQGPTFKTTRVSSFIDLTLSCGEVVVQGWNMRRRAQSNSI